MKSPKFLLLVSSAFLAPFASAAAQAQTPSATTPVVTESQRLSALFAADDEASLKRNPLNAMFRGDMRYADQFGDYISDAYFEGERKAAVNELARLARINPVTRRAAQPPPRRPPAPTAVRCRYRPSSWP